MPHRRTGRAGRAAGVDGAVGVVDLREFAQSGVDLAQLGGCVLERGADRCLESHGVLAQIGLDKKLVLNAGPYLQKQTLRRQGCQIDLLLRTRRSLYVFEIKFRKQIEASIVDEVQEKVKRLKLPKGLSVRTGLIYMGQLAPEIDGKDDLDFLVPTEELLKP